MSVLGGSEASCRCVPLPAVTGHNLPCRATCATNPWSSMHAT